MNHRVVITGMGAITPIGSGKEIFWQNLLKGVSGIKEISFPGVDMEQYRSRLGAPVEDFDSAAYLPRSKKLKYFGRASLFGLATTRLALEDAGFALSTEGEKIRIRDEDPRAIGVILGAASGNMDILEKQARQFAVDNGPRRFSPHALPHQLISSITAGIAIMYGCKGMNYVVPTSCCSASQAIGNSYLHLKAGQEQVIITGGADSGMNPLVFGGFSALRAMSTRNREPERACRPFDLERDGFVMGEGAGILVLEKLDHAIARGASIIAEIIGFGATADAYHLTNPDPEGHSLAGAVTIALNEAGLTPPAVAYINAHGTSTRVNDPVETRAIKQALGSAAYRIPISATKSMTGHLLGAAGGIEAIATALTIRDAMIHPTVNYEFPDPECDLDYVPNKMRKATVKTALSLSAGFGGFNNALIFRAYEG